MNGQISVPSLGTEVKEQEVKEQQTSALGSCRSNNHTQVLLRKLSPKEFLIGGI